MASKTKIDVWTMDTEVTLYLGVAEDDAGLPVHGGPVAGELAGLGLGVGAQPPQQVPVHRPGRGRGLQRGGRGQVQRGRGEGTRAHIRGLLLTRARHRAWAVRRMNVKGKRHSSFFQSEPSSTIAIYVL